MDSDSDSDRSHFDDSDDSEVQQGGFNRDLDGIRNNYPNVNVLEGNGGNDFIDNITNDEWEEIGRDISNNTHLMGLYLSDDALNDEKISFLFRGLTSSSSIEKLWLYNNELSIAGVRSMVPFLQHANNLRELDLNGNDLQSEGFNILCRALRDSPIEELLCNECGIESIEIDIDYFPRKLKYLFLSYNNINTDGCREITKLLQGRDSTLTHLNLNLNNIDDESVAILVNVLRNNTSLEHLGLLWNSGISKTGLIMLLKLVNDISSVKATLQSNHTLASIKVYDKDSSDAVTEEVQRQIDMAARANETNISNSGAAGRAKVIQTQLHSATRAAFAEIQGVSQSVYSEIDPLYLPEVLSLVGRRHGQGELFVALKSSIAGLISTVNKKEYLKQELAYHEAKSAEIRALLAAIEAAEVDDVANKSTSSKQQKTP